MGYYLTKDFLLRFWSFKNEGPAGKQRKGFVEQEITNAIGACGAFLLIHPSGMLSCLNLAEQTVHSPSALALGVPWM